MKRLLISISLVMVSSLVQAQELKIISIKPSAFGKKYMCTALGGDNIAPALTITHTKGIEKEVSIQMIDKTTAGHTFPHFKGSFPLSSSGITKLTSKDIAGKRFIAACNTQVHNFTSNYTWIVDGKEMHWGKITSGQIVR